MKHLHLVLTSMIIFSIFMTSCTEEEPYASFTCKSSAEVNEVITFTNSSTFATNFSWDFGDGNTSTDENPTHSYSSEGNFTVTLTASGDGGENSTSETITVAYPVPVANFTMDKTEAEPGETITFTNSTQNAISYLWDFGDDKTSTDENPTHAYSSDGTFTVTLTATGVGDENSTSKTITVAYPAPVANFTMDKTEAETGETITFTNSSENATTYSWDFGDGNTSTDENPTHSYSSDDTFTVTLTATGDGGENSISKMVTINYPAPIVDFTMGKSEVEIGETISFTNSSENATSYSCDFGDGNSSVDENPTHSYSSDGTFTVTLTATGNGGENSTSKTIKVNNPLVGKWKLIDSKYNGKDITNISGYFDFISNQKYHANIEKGTSKLYVEAYYEMNQDEFQCHLPSTILLSGTTTNYLNGKVTKVTSSMTEEDFNLYLSTGVGYGVNKLVGDELVLKSKDGKTVLKYKKD